MAIYTKEEQLELIKEDWINLYKIDNQYEEVCIEAVKQNGWAIKYVKEQTEEICLEAVKENGRVLEYVKEQTEKVCLEAVKNYGFTLLYVKEQTPKICLEAVKQDIEALRFVSSNIIKNDYEKFLKYSLKLDESKYGTLENVDLSKYCFCIMNDINKIDIINCKDEYINNLKLIICPYDIISKNGFLDYIIKLNSKIAFMIDTSLDESVMKDMIFSNNHLIILKNSYTLNKYLNLANYVLNRDNVYIEFDIPF